MDETERDIVQSIITDDDFGSWAFDLPAGIKSKFTNQLWSRCYISVVFAMIYNDLVDHDQMTTVAPTLEQVEDAFIESGSSFDELLSGMGFMGGLDVENKTIEWLTNRFGESVAVEYEDYINETL